jgi:hypothetical protein
MWAAMAEHHANKCIAGKPEEFAALAIQMIENKMLNGDTVRLDGGIRMPRL